MSFVELLAGHTHRSAASVSVQTRSAPGGPGLSSGGPSPPRRLLDPGCCCARAGLSASFGFAGRSRIMLSHGGFQSSRQNFAFGPWTVTAAQNHIMKSKDVERLSEEMNMPSLPEMLFGDNVLRIQHVDGFGIEFNAVDALRRVNNLADSVKVACAQEWQQSRADSEHSKEVVRPYDWTYTTDYKGTLIGDGERMKEVPTDERIDLDRLKVREQIVFFQEVLLFEDELHDHGVSTIGVKIRVMPTSFFVLMRFFLRVDGVLIRVHDTRLYHEAGKSFMLREFSMRENRMEDLKGVPAPLFTDPNEVAPHLALKLTHCDKLEIPQTEPMEPQ